MRAETVVFEHPEYGEAFVTFEWEKLARGLYRWRVVAVEFGLFVPLEEQETLLAWATEKARRSEPDQQGSIDLPWRSTGDPELPAPGNRSPA